MPTKQPVKKPLGWGITGIGQHMDIHVAPALRKAADTRVVAVHSRSMERAKSFAAKFGVDRTYDSFEKMLEDSELDVLYVATPNNLHAQQTIQAAQAGKHVLCEKPMALTEGDCQRMIEACKTNKVKLGMVFQNRYHPAHIEARRLISAGEVGKIPVVRAEYGHSFLSVVLSRGWRSDLSVAGAGALVGTGVHPIDLLRFLLDSEIVEVHAQCEPPEGLDETVYVILKFSNGTVGIVTSGAIPRCSNDVVVYGTKARITGKGTVGMLMLGELQVEGESINAKMSFPTNEPDSASYRRLIEAFNRCLRGNTEPEVSGYDGLQMCRITNAILESSHQGRAIRIEN